MLFDERSCKVVLFGLAIISIALLQYFSGIAFTYKGLLYPKVAYRKKEEDKFSFYFSVGAQFFFGLFVIVVAVGFAIFRFLNQ